MNVQFEDKELERLISDGSSKKYKKYAKDKAFVESLREIYAVMVSVANAADLKQFSWLDYEKLKYGYSGLSSVRVLKKRVERVIFRETDNGIQIVILELNTDHYGNKK